MSVETDFNRMSFELVTDNLPLLLLLSLSSFIFSGPYEYMYMETFTNIAPLKKSKFGRKSKTK